MLLHGNSLQILKDINNESIDLIVTDPPYGIEFMGKDWDKALPSIDIWKECFRVLKTGKLAFVMCSPRQDVLSRMIISLEDAGFRTNYTSIYWTYASGFPKAANVSKLMDKRFKIKDDYEIKREPYIKFADYLKQNRVKQNKSMNDISKFFPSRNGGLTGRVWNWENATEVPTVEQYIILKKELNLDNSFDDFVNNERETVVKMDGVKPDKILPASGVGFMKPDSEDWHKTKHRYIMPSTQTEEAKKMEGAYVGFQPKPALEIVIQAVKPLPILTELTIIISHCLYWIHCKPVNNVVTNSSLVQTVEEFIVQNTAMVKIVEEATANIGKVVESCEQTDILKSTLEELTVKQDTNWNTGLLWKSILVALLAKMNRFTTETITEQIIELKTLNSLLSQNIQDNTTHQQETRPSGSKLNVLVVESILVNALIRLLSINNTSVPLNASNQNQISLAYSVENNSQLLDTITKNGNTVHSNATTIPVIVASKGKTLTWLDNVKIPEGETKRFPANLLVSDNVLGEYSRYFSLDSWADTSMYLKIPKASKSEKNQGLETPDKLIPDYKITKSVRVNEPNKIEFINYIKSKLVNGKTGRQLDTLLREAGLISPHCSMSTAHYFGDTQFRIPNPEIYLVIKEYLHLDDRYDKQMLEFIELDKEESAGHTKFPQVRRSYQHNHHPTVKPLKLFSYLITMGSRENDLILDPFCGSGTTLIAADNLARKYIGIEINKDYLEIAKHRLLPHIQQTKLDLTEYITPI